MSDACYCKICSSTNGIVLNSFKHYCYVCSDCNCVSHFKKQRYLTEWLIPRFLAKFVLPRKAFLRLFSDRGDFEASDFYDHNAFIDTNDLSWRKSEAQELEDRLLQCDVKISDGLRVLDVSGGPGHIAKWLTKEGCDVVVTEYSADAAKGMADSLGLNTVSFDYTQDTLSKKVDGKFDLILVRSSIIFCPDLQSFINDLKTILNPRGGVYIESILPTQGEVLWWQQLEYKFPVIYSQEHINSCLLDSGFSFEHASRDVGSYIGVKWRSYNTLSKHFFTWMVEFPILCFYWMLNLYKRPAFDCSMNHKMIYTFWRVGASRKKIKYVDYVQGKANKSKTFGYRYNGYISQSRE